MSVKVTVIPNGPYLVEGDFKVTKADGAEVAHQGEKTALCRCGHSANKPFCDGAHARQGFKAE